MAASLYKLSDLDRRWVKKMVWVREGYEYEPLTPSYPYIPSEPIEPIDDDPGDPFHWCDPGYHPVRTPVLTGPYASEPEYRLEYFWSCVLN